MISRFDCPQCGTEIVVDSITQQAATRCNVCHNWVEVPAPARGFDGRLSGRDYRRGASAELASRGNRLAARLIDVGIFFVLGFGIGLVQGIIGANPEGFLGGAFFWMAALALMVYQFYLLTAYGQTIGKQLMKIKIVKQDTKENGGFVPNVLLREIVNGLFSIIFLYALFDIAMIFNADHRCIHDRLAGTVVVNANEPVPQAPRPQERPTSVAR